MHDIGIFVYTIRMMHVYVCPLWMSFLRWCIFFVYNRRLLLWRSTLQSVWKHDERLCVLTLLSIEPLTNIFANCVVVRCSVSLRMYSCMYRCIGELLNCCSKAFACGGSKCSHERRGGKTEVAVNRKWHTLHAATKWLQHQVRKHKEWYTK